ncbi:hypothetical protein AB3Z07_21155 [Metabacillus halosaccharovorans]|uniref:hypothetical protein n=1 Tax=Metabacillus halosaccharovorans TaxID=930124 RepID=UPI0034CD9E48
MAITYFPFDTGQGANITEEQWNKMAQQWVETGIIQRYLNELDVYADSSGMQVKVKSGSSWIKGHYFESDAEEILSIGQSDAINPRIDRVIVRMDRGLNLIELAVLQGTPSVSPIPPVMTQNTSRWEISLAFVSVPAGAVTISSNNITDDRTFIAQLSLIPRLNASESGESYPIGVTQSSVDLSVSGYPESYGLVVNMKMGSHRFTQWFFSHGNTTGQGGTQTKGAWFRHWYNNIGWTAWQEVNTKRTEAGTASINISNNNVGSAIITFNKAFAQAPSVMVVPTETVGGKAWNVYKITTTTTSATIYFISNDSTAVTGTLPFSFIVVER